MKWKGIIVDRVFIVVDPDPLVNLDLVGIIKNAFPKSRVVNTQMVSEAMPILLEGKQRSILVIRSAALGKRLAEALKNFVARQGAVILIGNDMTTDFPKEVVDMPFTDDMILNAISSAASDLPVRPPASRT